MELVADDVTEADWDELLAAGYVADFEGHVDLELVPRLNPFVAVNWHVIGCCKQHEPLVGPPELLR